jgi:hypothetical protein
MVGTADSCYLLVTLCELRDISIIGEPLRAFTTTCLFEKINNTQSNDHEHGKNVKDWAIRR